MSARTIVLGGGCFWCIEAIYQRVKGITAVTSGYAGGHTPNPTYREVSNEQTGHVEVVKVDFEDSVISLQEILDIFFHLHDPTTLNRQGHDVGSQYRSAIYYKNSEDLRVINQAKDSAAPDWKDPIVTEIKPLDIFYPAEEYHQNYFNQHPDQGYCQLVINPKIAKLREKYFTKVQS